MSSPSTLYKVLEKEKERKNKGEDKEREGERKRREREEEKEEEIGPEQDQRTAVDLKQAPNCQEPVMKKKKMEEVEDFTDDLVSTQ